MRNPIFKGIATAMITPFHADGTVDYEAFGRMIDFQIDNGINGLVVCATTGEAPTLTDEEHMNLIRFAVERSAGRVPVIAGTGSNYTGHAIEMTKYACEAGADAVLVCRPFVPAVYGGGAEGVQALVSKLGGELADAMEMCGAASLKDITSDMIRF